MSHADPGRPGAGRVPASRAAYVLLGAMSLVSFGGPLAIALIVRGGDRASWPPDTTAEWVGVSVVFALFAACLIACLTVRFWLLRPAAKTGPADGPVEP